MGVDMTMDERRAALSAALDRIEADTKRRREAERLLFCASCRLGELAWDVAENHRKSGGEEPDEVDAARIVAAFGIQSVRTFDSLWSSGVVNELAGYLWEGANALRSLREEGC